MSLTTGTITLDQWLTFGRTIKDARVAHGWPLRKFARMAGISFGYLGFLETAKAPPPSDAVLMRMAELLEIPAPTLFALAGRLPPDVTTKFWEHPAVPAILSTVPGMTLADAQTFCAQINTIHPIT
jgi:transcriptional regulator with XRE-family HTH domain